MQNVDHKLEFIYLGVVTKETSAGGNMYVELQYQPIELIQPSGDNYPMGWVSSRSINEFLQKLNSITGLNFRLPTSDEWDFAARGGNKSHGYKYSGSNIYEEVGQTPKIRYLKCPVKEKAPNELGIYDMSGNVDELCIDAASYSGYSYNNFSDYNCNGYYPFDFPGDLGNLFGFRIVLSSQNSEE
ncbi:MAG: SUMF1/EgtB/PvdO family nonheme iron enzyme [Bacteroidales bacterium]|nr:SUMF1/EgtB/PvdO family nonheme iron enzyme [Bacteroidales bacterium]